MGHPTVRALEKTLVIDRFCFRVAVCHFRVPPATYLPSATLLHRPCAADVENLQLQRVSIWLLTVRIVGVLSGRDNLSRRHFAVGKKI